MALPARAFALLCCAAIGCAHADTLWRNDWFSSAPPTLARVYGNTENTVAYAANGDVVLASESYAWYDYQIVRFGADGALRWSSNVGSSLLAVESTPNAMIATADGGALVAVGQSYYHGTPEYLVRIDATGEVAWAREIPAQAIAELATERVVATGCKGVTVLDAASGDVVWQTTASMCPQTPRVAVDDSLSIYTLQSTDGEVHAVRESADGALVWDAPLGVDWAGIPAIAASSGDLVFAQANGTLFALHVTDGAIAWSVSAEGRLLLAANPVEPVLVDGDSATRFAAGTGQTQWTTPVSGGGAVIVGNDLIAGSSTLRRIDLSSGSVVWATTLPASGGAYFSVGPSSAGSVVAVAQPYGGAAAPPVLERVAITDGSVAGAIPVPPVQQAPTGVSDGKPSGPIVGVLAAWTATAPELHTRRLDPVSGATLWEVSEPIDPDIFGTGTPPNNVMPSVAAGDALAIAAVAIDVSAGSVDIGQGIVWVAAYEEASGQRRWLTQVSDPEHGTIFNAQPIFDPQGDILLATAALVGCGANEGPRCARRTLFKISKDDGHVVWQSQQRYLVENNTVWPGMLVPAGDDVIVSGPYFESLDGPALRYVTSTGTTLWSSNVFDRDDIAAVRATPDGILVVGDGDGWAELDAATGSAHWTSPAFSSACGNVCLENRGVVLPDGNLLVIGEGGYQAQVSLLATDGSGTYRNWALVPDNDAVRSQAVDLRSDASGVRLNLLHGNRHGPGGVSVLARFDVATGSLLSQQVLRGRPGGLLDPVVSGGWSGEFDGDDLLMNTIAFDAPAATAWGDALVDTTITAHGDIALRLDVDRSQFDTTGLLGISAHMTYTGDAPVAGAHVNLYVPWHSGAREVACNVVGASNCTFDTRDGNILATVDLAPGAVVDVTARVAPIASDGSTPTLTGAAFGPVGLDEPNTLNNLAQKGSSPDDDLFADGFDGT